MSRGLANKGIALLSLPLNTERESCRLIYAETILLDEALLSPPPSTASRTSTQAPDPTHCDEPGWPKCYSVGFVRGWANPGTEPPSGHSEDYCRGYRDGASKSNSNLATQDPTHCDIEGWPICVSGWRRYLGA